MDNKNMPVFVYGTLINGFGNYNHFLKGNTVDEQEATAEGFQLYDVANGGFPGIIKGEGTVKGQLMYFSDYGFENALKQLDRLEGYQKWSSHNMYVREEVTVKNQLGEPVQAWIYLWNNKVIKQTRITSGCWREYSLEPIDEEVDEDDE